MKIGGSLVIGTKINLSKQYNLFLPINFNDLTILIETTKSKPSLVPCKTTISIQAFFLRGLGFAYFIAFLCLWNDLYLSLEVKDSFLQKSTWKEYKITFKIRKPHFGKYQHSFIFLNGSCKVALSQASFFSSLWAQQYTNTLWLMGAIFFVSGTVSAGIPSAGNTFRNHEIIFLVPLLHPTRRITPPKATIYLSLVARSASHVVLDLKFAVTLAGQI